VPDCVKPPVQLLLLRRQVATSRSTRWTKTDWLASGVPRGREAWDTRKRREHDETDERGYKWWGSGSRRGAQCAACAPMRSDAEWCEKDIACLLSTLAGRAQTHGSETETARSASSARPALLRRGPRMATIGRGRVPKLYRPPSTRPPLFAAGRRASFKRVWKRRFKRYIVYIILRQV